MGPDLLDVTGDRIRVTRVYHRILCRALGEKEKALHLLSLLTANSFHPSSNYDRSLGFALPAVDALPKMHP
jgi:hypothetical protein